MDFDRSAFQEAVYGALAQAVREWNDLAALCLDLTLERGREGLTLLAESRSHLSAQAEADPEEALLGKYRPETWRWGLTKDLSALLPEAPGPSLVEPCTDALLRLRQDQPDLMLMLTTSPEMGRDAQISLFASLNGSADAEEFSAV